MEFSFVLQNDYQVYDKWVAKVAPLFIAAYCRIPLAQLLRIPGQSLFQLAQPLGIHKGFQDAAHFVQRCGIGGAGF